MADVHRLPPNRSGDAPHDAVRDALEEFARALDEGLTVDGVLDVVTGRVGVLTGAEAMAVALLEVTGEWVHAARAVGFDTAVLDRLRRFRVDADLPLAEAIRTGRTVVTGEIDVVAAPPDVRWALERSGRRAMASLPLQVGGRVIGGLGLSFRDPQRFDLRQLRLLLDIADLTATAIEGAQERRSSGFGPRRSGGAEGIAAAALVMHGPLDMADALARLAASAGQAVGGTAAVAALTVGLTSSPLVGTWSDDDHRADPELLRGVVRERLPSARLRSDGSLAAPLTAAGGERLGTVAVAPPVLRSFDESDAIVLSQLARLGSAAVELAYLRDVGQRSGERMAFLSAATRELGRTLSTTEVLRSLARLAVPRLADRALVHMVEGHRLVQVASAHRSVLHGGLPSPAEATYPLDADVPICRALLTGGVVPLEPDDDAGLLAGGLAIPILTDGRSLGVLSLIVEQSTRRLDHDDVAAARELVTRAAIALRNAGRYETEQSAVDLLQAAVLPEQLPAVDGLELAARYEPASEKALVGGDWYDAFVLRDGRVGLSVGDVVGRGLRAASAMSQLRTALRAYAVDGDDPATVLERLNRFASHARVTEFATVAYAVLDPGSGRLEWADAGHPPILHASAAGGSGHEVRFLAERHATPIGVPSGSAPQLQTTVLGPGDVLVLYTDGLVERRAEGLDTGLDRLAATARRALADADPLDPDRVCTLLLESAPPERGDDICVLYVRRVGASRANGG
jgi:serine phosphatase RsbU (regulator of sigma subunit)